MMRTCARVIVVLLVCGSSPSMAQAVDLSEMSLMFPRSAVRGFERVLEQYEERLKAKEELAQTQEDDVDRFDDFIRSIDQGKEVEIIEDKILPDFYLGAIVYRHANDWAVWINEERLTSRNPISATQGIEIMHVSEEKIRFVWSPDDLRVAFKRYRDLTDEYDSILQEPDNGIAVELEGKSADMILMYKQNRVGPHREANDAEFWFNSDERQFEVSMRSNQTFASDVMQMINGRYRNQRDVGESTIVSTEDPSGNEVSQTSRMTTDSMTTVNDLVENLQNLNSFIPQTAGRE